MANKPRVLVDIKTARLRIFKGLPPRINLFSKKTIYLPLSTGLKLSFVLLAAFSLIFGSAMAPLNHSQSLAAQTDAERQELEEQLADLESQISQYESTVASYKQQGSTLQKELNRLNAQMSKINLQIKAVNLSLTRLDDEIVDNRGKITSIEDDIELSKSALTRAMQSVYENENVSLLAILIKNASLSDFFGDINNWMEVQGSLNITLDRITKLRQDLLQEREVLAIKRNDVESLKIYQDAQRKDLASAKTNKDDLLKTTKGQESKYQAILQEKLKTAAQVRSQIFSLLGGGEMTFEEAYKFARFAEQVTGVRAAMILAVLDRESALGYNVGKCNYKTAMHPTRDIPPFLALTESLGINPDTIMVSCPNRDGAYGGAMGPAQFIPSTWVLYSDRIGDLTGSNPPSPWRNGDAFMGTGLYLKDAGAADAALDKERIAAARYYAGGRWRNFVWSYGDWVVRRAQQFQEDIDILNS
ncbi:MAG: lytic murein transglycosylase [bacterium]|nr:lytic murein transglycosylase [bacterium]